MSDLLIQATISNLLVSTLLAGIAWTVQLRVRSASLVNLLWVIVLIKLVTPPMYFDTRHRTTQLFTIPAMMRSGTLGRNRRVS